MIHEYQSNDISTCLASRKMVFLGDSTIRNIFWETAKKLDLKEAGDKARKTQKHTDISFSSACVNLDFIWDPYLNSTKLQRVLASQRHSWYPQASNMHGNMTMAILIIGGGLWHARHLNLDASTRFEASIHNIISSITHGNSKHLNMTFSRDYRKAPSPNDLVIIAPVQTPLYGSSNTSSKPKSIITPGTIKPLNDYFHDISTLQNVPVAWSYALMTQDEEKAYEEGGIHVTDTVARQQADILLNMRCNAAITRSKQYPMDKTCCSRYPPANWVQRLMVIGTAAVLPFVALTTTTSMSECIPTRL